MFIVGRSISYRSEYCKLARAAVPEAVHADRRLAAVLDAERGRGNRGNRANLENPTKMRIGRAEDFLAATRANRGNSSPAMHLVRKKPGTRVVSAENAGNAEIQKSRGNWASDGTAIEMQKIAENAENPPGPSGWRFPAMQHVIDVEVAPAQRPGAAKRAVDQSD